MVAMLATATTNSLAPDVVAVAVAVVVVVVVVWEFVRLLVGGIGVITDGVVVVGFSTTIVSGSWEGTADAMGVAIGGRVANVGDFVVGAFVVGVLVVGETLGGCVGERVGSGVGI